MKTKIAFTITFFIFVGLFLSPSKANAQSCPYTRSLSVNRATCEDTGGPYPCEECDNTPTTVTESCFYQPTSCIAWFIWDDCSVSNCKCTIDYKTITESCGPPVPTLSPTPGNGNGNGNGGPTPPPPPPSCTVSLTPASATTTVGGTVLFTASVTPSNGTVDRVNFSSSALGVATVSPSSDSTSPYSTTATGVSPGSSTITSDVVMGGSVLCSDTSSLSVTCLCDAWAGAACGGGSCPADRRLLTRTCIPAGCEIESDCSDPDPACTPGCDCTPWADSTCGGSAGALTCLPSQRLQTRSCDLATCPPGTEEAQCVADPTCIVPPPCEISIPNVPLSGVGDSQPITVGGAVGVTSVTFSSSDISIATVSPLFDGGALFQTTVTAESIGSTTYNAVATAAAGGFCSDTATVTVSNPNAWWQVREGDIVTNGSITSNIPASCVAPCDPVLISYDSIAIPPAYPGVPSTGIAETINTGSGTISNPPYGWAANESPYSSAQTYDYAFFEARNPSSVTPTDPGLTLDIADVTTGALGPNGYYWFQTSPSTDLQITNPGGASSVGSNKVIVFVDGNLTIDGPITVLDGVGSFTAIVSRDIIVNPSVRGPQEIPIPLPDLEGLYITDGNFNTGKDPLGPDLQLHVRGSVAAPQGTINFQRELADNSQTPGEIFEYGADQAIFFHQDLTPVRTIWREVAP